MIYGISDSIQSWDYKTISDKDLQFWIFPTRNFCFCVEFFLDMGTLKTSLFIIIIIIIIIISEVST